MKSLAIVFAALLIAPAAEALAQTHHSGGHARAATSCSSTSSAPRGRANCSSSTRVFRAAPGRPVQRVVRVCASRSCRPCRRYVLNKSRQQRVSVARPASSSVRVRIGDGVINKPVRVKVGKVRVTARVRRTDNRGRTTNLQPPPVTRRTPSRVAPPTGRTPTASPLAPRLVAAMTARDLVTACRLASWADGDPKRQEILRRALFMQLPSPTVIEDSVKELRTGAGWQGLPGRDTLLRILEGARARSR